MILSLKRNSFSNSTIFTAISLFALAVDQLTKAFVRFYLPQGASIKVIDGVLSLEHVTNTGAAFSLFAEKVEILTVVSLLAVVIIPVYCYKTRINSAKAFEISGWGLLLGGTAGNLIDRLFLSGVTDFISFTLINFPVFNVADICIDVGAFIIIVSSFLKRHERTTESKNRD